MRRYGMKKLLICLAIVMSLFLVTVGVYACEMHFSLISSDGAIQNILPGKSTSLSQGESYILQVEFIQDHKRCVIPAEETVYLLLEEKWKSTKDYLPLQLVSQGAWISDSSEAWTQEINFEATQKGQWELEIVRDCSKGGYDEIIIFQVQ
jgi:hypothetical protein